MIGLRLKVAFSHFEGGCGQDRPHRTRLARSAAVPWVAAARQGRSKRRLCCARCEQLIEEGVVNTPSVSIASLRSTRIAIGRTRADQRPGDSVEFLGNDTTVRAVLVVPRRAPQNHSIGTHSSRDLDGTRQLPARERNTSLRHERAGVWHDCGWRAGVAATAAKLLYEPRGTHGLGDC